MFKNKKIIFLMLTIISLSVVAALQYKILFYSDISMTPVSPSDNADYQAKTYKSRLPVYFISYADGAEVFYKNQHALVLSALNRGFDFFFNYRRSHIDPEFYQKHKNILDKPRGAGYWIWKPYFILKTLESIPENSLLIYCDSGFTFKKSPKVLLDQLKEQDIVLVAYDPAIYGLVGNLANKETLKRMECDNEKCRANIHTWAGFSAFRNTPRARAFVREWLKYCTDETIIFGHTGADPEYPEFKYHQDDETVLSVMHARHPDWCGTIPEKQLSSFLVWHHRHPEREYRSLLPYMSKEFNSKDRGILNSKLSIWLRGFFMKIRKKES